MSGITALKSIVRYSEKSLMEGIYKGKPKRFIRMLTASIPEENVNIPLSCFTRTKSGDVVLYRGLNLDRLLDDTNINYSNSVAATAGISAKEILSEFNKKTKKAIREIACLFSGITRGNDPVVHTTTKRRIARHFAKKGGILVEYHIPKEFMEHKGIVGHLGEEEIDFFYRIPDRFVAKVTHSKEPAWRKKTITVNATPTVSNAVTQNTNISLPSPPPELMTNI